MHSNASKGNNIESLAIDWLRFPMAALVVLLHTGSLGCDSYYPVYSNLCILFPNGICRVAVPMFFLFSGYFYFKGLEEWSFDVYLSKIRKRCRTLLVPYILWNIIAAILLLSYSYLRGVLNKDGFVSIHEIISGWNGIGLFWNADKGLPLDYPLWFIRNLIIFVLAFPAIFFFIKKLGRWGIIGLFVINLIFGRFLEGLFFFSLGGFLMINGRSIISLAQENKKVCIISSLLLLASLTFVYKHNIELYGILRRAFVLPGIFAFFSLVSGGISTGKLNLKPFLASSSFFIFATHGILILHDFARFIVLHILPSRGELFYCIDLFLRPTIAVAICLGLYWIMSKVTPRTLAILTGGRVPNS